MGLEIGADDYICKPYSPREVVARVKTILRRCSQQRHQPTDDAPLLINESRFQASYQGHMLELTPAEFRLLKILASQPGHVFSREQLLNNLYDDYRVVTDRTIDSHIKIYSGNWNYSMAKTVHPRGIWHGVSLGSRDVPFVVILFCHRCAMLAVLARYVCDARSTLT